MKTSRYSGFKGRKAFVGDILTLIIIIFVLSITIMTGYLMLSKVNTAFQATPDIGTQGQTIVNDATSKYTNLWDGIFAFLLVGLSLATAISAYFIDTHPLLMPLLLIVLVAYVFVAASISNAYWSVASDTAFSGFAENFKVMYYVMTHLAWYALIEGFVVFMALFAKVNSGA